MKSKQKIKKIMATILLIVILINVIPTTSSLAQADVNFTVSSTTASIGDTINVTVSVDNVVDVVAGELTVKYNPEQLEFVPPTEGIDYITDATFFERAMPVAKLLEAGRINVTFAKATPITKSGTVLNMQFKVLQGGNLPITLEVPNYIDSSNVQFTKGITNGTVAVNAPLESVSLNKNTTTILKGETEELLVELNPKYTTDEITVDSWESSNTSVATVTDGVVTALSKGDTIITANITNKTTNAKLTATCTIYVTEINLIGISLDEEEITLSKGSTQKVNVTYNPSNTTDDKSITWSSDDETVAKVDENGNIEAVGGGSTNITATSKVNNSITATCKVKVTSKLTDTNLDKSSLNLNKGDSSDLTLMYVPEDATADNLELTWISSNTNIATVTPNASDNKIATVKAVGGGDTTITAKVVNKSTNETYTKECAVSVDVPLTGIEIKLNTSITTYQSEILQVTYKPSDTNSDKSVEWSSDDETIAKVDTNGKVTGVAPGTANITVTSKIDSSIKSTCVVTVEPIPLNSIKLSSEKIDIEKEEFENLTIIRNPDNTTDDLETAVWSSEDEDIAKVDNTGKVSAIKPGTTTIKASVYNKTKNETYTATCEVTVISTLTGISIDKDNIELEKKETEQITVSLFPSDTTDKLTTKWSSSNPRVATVSETGNVTAVSGGQTVITVSVHDETTTQTYTKTCNVKVLSPLTGIQIKDKTRIARNQSETLKVSYLPEDTTDNRNIKWESADPSIATVDENGRVRGISVGTTTITAKSEFNDTFTSSCEVEVYKRTINKDPIEEKPTDEIPIDEIKINEINIRISKGHNKTLSILITPEDATVNKTVIWTSSDESVATINENGEITALKAGKTIITAKIGEKTTTTELEVYEVPLNSIIINFDENEVQQLLPNKTLQLTVSFNPIDTTDNNVVVWTSSDETIATVDKNGIVTALKSGTVTITATVNDKVNSSTTITVQAEENDQQKEENDQQKGETKPENIDKNTSPKTADLNIALLVLLMIGSLTGIVLIIRKKNTRHS